MSMRGLDSCYISNRVDPLEPGGQGLRAHWDPAGRVGQPGFNNGAWTLVRWNYDQHIVWELCLSLKHHLFFFHLGKLDLRAKRDSPGCKEPLHLFTYYRTSSWRGMRLRGEKLNRDFLFLSCEMILQEQSQTIRRDGTLDRQSRNPDQQSPIFKILQGIAQFHCRFKIVKLVSVFL